MRSNFQAETLVDNCDTMDDFTVPINIKLACSYWPQERGFEDVVVEIDLKRDTVRDLKKKIDPSSSGVNGFVIFYGQFLDDNDAFHNFYDGHVKLIVLDFGTEWSESPGDVSGSNLALRIIRGGFSPEMAVRALSRAAWHPGFDEFVKAAASLKKLTELSFARDEVYADRVVVPTVDADAQRSVCGVVRANRSVFFPTSMQDLAAYHAAHDVVLDGPFPSGAAAASNPIDAPSGDASDAPKDASDASRAALAIAAAGCRVVPNGRRAVQRRKVGADARAARARAAARLVANVPTITAASHAVVRLFGMHPIESGVAAGSAAEAARRAASSSQPNGHPAASAATATASISHVLGESAGTADSGGGAADALTDAVLDAGMARCRAVGFTGFFVAPRIIMTSLSGAYDAQTDTYATSFRFSRSLYAPYYSLTDGEDVFDCDPIHDVPDSIVAAIRRTGVSLPDADVPPSLAAVSWKDVLLLHVRDPAAANATFLVPEPAPVADGSVVAVPFYASRPDHGWVSWLTRANGGAAFRDGLGPLAPEAAFTSDDLTDVFHGYEGLVVGHGETVMRKGGGHAAELDEGLFLHTAALCPGGLGAPVFVLSEPPDEWVVGDPPIAAPPVVTFVGMITGRARVAYLSSESTAYGMSSQLIDGRATRGVGGGSMRLLNAAVPVSATWLAFVIEQFVAPAVTTAANAAGRESHAALALGVLKRWSAQFRVVFQAERLAVCHEKMVRDADSLNEFGMDMYERSLLSDALICFREGARMFSLATIPNLTAYEVRLYSCVFCSHSNSVAPHHRKSLRLLFNPMLHQFYSRSPRRGSLPPLSMSSMSRFPSINQ